LITFERKKIGGAYFQSVTVNKNFEPARRSSVSYYIQYNKDNKYTKKNISKKDKNKLSLTDYPKTNKYFKKVKSLLLDHPKYNHPIYKERFDRIEAIGISNKELNNIKRFRKKIKFDDVKKYTEWWIKEKSKKFTGFSFGIFAYPGILDEFIFKVKKEDPYEKLVKKTRDTSVRKRRIQNMKKRIKKMNLNDIKDFEWDILKAAEAFQLVEIKGKKVKILFGSK
ncbi:hypothetical protein KY343_07280, partial [Candidatus Woesearchaeota archaeon]|nr:hypothetical protein [Candidatus Woesearchaeota archaeon]